MTMNLFRIGPDTFVANDYADVKLVFAEHVGEPYNTEDHDEIDMLEDNELLIIRDEEGNHVESKLAYEWAATSPRGFLSSTEI